MHVAAPIDPALLEVALGRVKGTPFEDFVNAFMAGLVGATYVPVGGQGDGGADGYIVDHLREEAGRPTSFLQTSIQADTAGKIRQTVKRLREVGRTPRTLTYCTSQAVSNVEQVEHNLSSELDVGVRIRDRRYISAHINTNNQTTAAYTNHLEGLTHFLRRIGAGGIISRSDHVKNPDVLVFLRQEVDRRDGGAPLADSVVDTLAIWALEDTDPDAGRYMTSVEVFSKIVDEFPSARPYLEASLRSRLEAMSAKRFPGGRMVRWHRKEDLFALPYEARQRIALDNAEDLALYEGMAASLLSRLEAVLPEDDVERLAETCRSVLTRALQLGFEQEGLEFAHFISRGGEVQHTHYLADALATAMDEHRIAPADLDLVGDAGIEVIRQLFYGSDEVERQYLERLSRTYAILFTLQSEPRLIDYFEEMSGAFYLYVGSDIVIRALSERYLAPADQMTRNMIEMARVAGATLVLADPVLEEVVSHLRATDHEFEHHVAGVEDVVGIEIARNASKILIRSYFYARIEDEVPDGQRPLSWEQYVGQFCDLRTLHQPAAFSEMRQYLQAQFGFEFEPRAKLLELVDRDAVKELAVQLERVKTKEELALNDALMCHAVYGRRRQREETSTVSEFGYSTWWLTGGEQSIARFTSDLVKANHGDRYIMRPEFLLNFISLAPSAAEARQTFANVFPTLLGVRVARRMDTQSFGKLMDDVEACMSLEHGRRQAKMSQTANALKSDLRRQYRKDFKADFTYGSWESIKTSALDKDDP